MCLHEGYHRALPGEIEAEWGSREGREEIGYDLPWRVLAVFVGAVVAIGSSLSFLIQLLR